MGETPDPTMSGDDSTRAIRRDIERTQREMSHTIDEIQHRLSPAYIKAQARESVRRAGVRTSRGTIDRVKSNPLGAAMVGVGLYLLLRNDDRGNDMYYERDVHFAGDFDEAYNAQREYRDFDYGYDRHAGRGRMAEMKDRVSDAADTAREKVSEKIDEAREGASHLSDRAGDRAHEMHERARYQAMRARMRSRDMMTSSPLVMGLAAAAFGAVIGAMIPESERENQLFGETRDRLADRASGVAREGLDRAKHIAKDVATAAADTAKREVRSAKDDLKRNVDNGTMDEFR